MHRGGIGFRWYGTAVRWAVFSNAYIALCGGALTAATYSLFGLPPRVDAAVGLVFYCTLVIYNLDRLVEPHPGDSEHERWVQRHRRWLWALTGLAAIGAGACAWQLKAATQYSLAAAGVVAVGYCLPIVGSPASTKPYRRLKDLPGAKLPLIALVWTYATAGLPMLQAGTAFDSPSVAILISRIFFFAAVALPFDIPDMQRDRQSGIVTLPTKYGLRATRRITLALAAVSMLTGLLTPWPEAIAILISNAAAIIAVAALRPVRGWVFFMVLLDGMLLLQACALWIITGL